GCQVPIGVNAFVQENDTIFIKAILGLPNGREFLTDTKIVKREEYVGVGRAMAGEMIERGAKELLKRAEEMANLNPQ
ncbi:MAG: hydroxymethylbilane synthase, partial [Sulfurimonadaceae bacterium]|nr:hydroxymethylbilane synthase [Sulfurimonadaceae bacterium]